MKAMIVAAVLAAAMVAIGTELCFGSGEKASGSNKICYYNCPSGQAAITVKGFELCPLSIKR